MPLKPIKTKDRLQKIKKDPLEVLNFCKYKLNGGRWPEAEPFILKKRDPIWALFYARDIIQGRWPEAELFILKHKDANLAYRYANEVIKGPWPEAEQIIKRDAAAWSYYTKKVLNKM